MLTADERRKIAREVLGGVCHVVHRPHSRHRSVSSYPKDTLDGFAVLSPLTSLFYNLLRNHGLDDWYATWLGAALL
jgi:hypothetical protein